MPVSIKAQLYGLCPLLTSSSFKQSANCEATRPNERL